jgi:hypothetical protein
MLAGLILAIAATGPSTILPDIEGFDLAKVQAREATCADRAGSDDIIVCAPKNMEIWVADGAGLEAKPLRTTFAGPFNAETIVHVIQQASPVASVPAAAVTLKRHF